MSQFDRTGSLSTYVLLFCRFLRDHHFIIGPEEESDSFRAISHLTLISEHMFKYALKSSLVKNHQQYVKFDSLFEAFRDQYRKGVDAKERLKPETPKNKRPVIRNIKSWLSSDRGDDKLSLASFSAMHVSASISSVCVPDDDLAELKKLIERFSEKMENAFNRRKKYLPRGGPLSLRTTLRKSMKHGGEIIQLYYSVPKKNNTQLFLLCDVSRSMDLYSVFLITFIYAFQQVFRNIETFVFSSRLYRVSGYLKEGNFSKAIEKMMQEVDQWSGGTRIGECLYEFVSGYERKIDSNSLVMILSDGIDLGDPALTKEAMKRIYRRAGRIIWFNPLAGHKDYQPETRAMKAALPFIDVLVPLYDMESLKSMVSRTKRFKKMV